MMLHTAKSLGVVIIAVALFTACSEALVSQVGGEFDKAAGECEVCEHCESGTELVDKEAGEEATAADTTEEGTSEDSAEKDGLEESDAKDDSVEAGNESDSKEVSEEETN